MVLKRIHLAVHLMVHWHAGFAEIVMEKEPGSIVNAIQKNLEEIMGVHALKKVNN